MLHFIFAIWLEIDYNFKRLAFALADKELIRHSAT